MTPISDILDKIDQVTQLYAFNGYTALSQAVAPTLTLAITVYIACVGWSSLQGWTQLSVGQAVKHVIKIAIAFTIATEWSFFSTYIYKVFTNGPNEVSSILMQAANSSSNSVNSALQDAFNQGLFIGAAMYNLSGFAPKLAAMVVWTLSFIVCGIALLELTIAKCGVAITLVLAPVFSVFLLWEGTKPIFDSWLRHALGFGLTPLFLSAVLLLIDQIMQLGLNELKDAIQIGDANIESITTFVLASIASTGLLIKAAHIAAGIASGINISGLETMRGALYHTAKWSGFNALRNARAAKRNQSNDRSAVKKARWGRASYGN